MFGSVCCRERKKIDGMKAGNTPAKPSTRLDKKKAALLREKNKLSQRKRRANMSAQKKSSEKKKKALYYQQKKSVKAVLEEVKRQRLLRAEQDAAMARQQGFLSAEAKRSAAYRLRKKLQAIQFSNIPVCKCALSLQRKCFSNGRTRCAVYVSTEEDTSITKGV